MENKDWAEALKSAFREGFNKSHIEGYEYLDEAWRDSGSTKHFHDSLIDDDDGY